MKMNNSGKEKVEVSGQKDVEAMDEGGKNGI